jgi:hypothetical protein
MSRYCDHYACPKELLDRFLTAAAEDRRGGAVGELVNDLYPNHGLLHNEINHKWEDIHRCLTFDTGEGLDFECGEEPLSLCIHGGEWLVRVGRSYRTVTLLRAEQLPALCEALDGIDEDFFRRTMRELRDEGVSRYADEGWTEQNVEVVWMDFRSLRDFYHKANAVRLPVICTISH